MRRLLSLFAVLLMSFGMLGGNALAQDDMTMTYCGDLSADDCALLESANDAMADVTEASFDLDILIEATGEGETLALGFNMAGAYSLDMMAIPDFESMDLEAMTLSETIDAVQALLSALGADVTITVDLPAEAAMQGLPMQLAVDSRFVNSTGYIDFDDLTDLTNGAFEGWHGMDLSQAVREISAFAGPDAMDQTLGELGFSLEDLGADTGQFTEAQNMMMENPGEFLTVQRLGDSTFNGVDVAVFETEIDMAALFADENFQQLLRDQIQAQSAVGLPMTEEELDEAVQAQVELFANAQPLYVTQAIGLDDNFIYDTTIDWVFEVPQDMQAEADGLESVLLDMSFSYGDFNNAPAIEAPADSTLHTVMELLGGFGGGMGGN